jgi:hypothetical protein
VVMRVDGQHTLTAGARGVKAHRESLGGTAAQ